MLATSDSGPPADRGDRGGGERLTEHRGVLQQRALRGRQPVEPRRDERVQRLGHLEIGDVAGDDVARALLNEHAAILEHADRLDRVQRDPLGALTISPTQLVGQPGREPVEISSRSRGQRREHQRLPPGRRSRSSGRPSASTKIGKSADHSSR